MTVDLARYRVAEGAPVRLADRDPADTGRYGSKAETLDELAAQRERIAELQERLYAEGRRALLIVLQAMDTGGKDGAVKHVLRGVNPQGCQVWSFKAPTSEELAHDFLWRYHHKAPGRGMIGLFNRSHYEDVLVVRVKQLVPETVWRPRYESIRAFERLLADEGTVVIKFFLHISRAEQKRRLQARLDVPEKTWKFDPGDLGERARWDDYTAAYEAAFAETSTHRAPWYVVPGDKKWFRNLVLAYAIADTLASMDPRFPPPAEGLEGLVIED